MSDARTVLLQHAPTRERDALLAVLNLHKPPTTDSPGLKDYCRECGTYALWPCDTVRIINKALGVSE